MNPVNPEKFCQSCLKTKPHTRYKLKVMCSPRRSGKWKQNEVIRYRIEPDSISNTSPEVQNRVAGIDPSNDVL